MPHPTMLTQLINTYLAIPNFKPNPSGFEPLHTRQKGWVSARNDLNRDCFRAIESGAVISKTNGM